MKFELFNPSKDEYKSVDDLPVEQRSAFENDKEGGFTNKEAVEKLKQAEAKAAELNQSRPLKEKLTGRNKVTALDILKEEAEVVQKEREETLLREREGQKKLNLYQNTLWRQFYKEVLDLDLISESGEVDDIYNVEPSTDVAHLQKKISWCCEWLLKHGNDLEKTKKDLISGGGQEFYEDNFANRIESVHEEIENEEKRLILKDELNNRHPRNPLFKNHAIFPPANIKNRGDYRSVFCATKEENLEYIGQNGLKFAGEEIMNSSKSESNGQVNSSKMELEKIFKDAAPVGLNRRLSVFAVPDYRDPSRAGAMGGMGNVVLEAKIDATKAIVVDVEDYNAIAESIQFFGADLKDKDFQNDALEQAKKYWSKAMPLAEYLKLSLVEQKRRFTTPEILIPEVVLPEQIKVASVLSEKASE